MTTKKLFKVSAVMVKGTKFCVSEHTFDIKDEFLCNAHIKLEKIMGQYGLTQDHIRRIDITRVIEEVKEEPPAEGGKDSLSESLNFQKQPIHWNKPNPNRVFPDELGQWVPWDGTQDSHTSTGSFSNHRSVK